MSMKLRDTLQFSEKDSTGEDRDNTIEFRTVGNRLTIEIDNPWYGDSEKGFGATLSIDLTIEQIKNLIDYLTKNFIAV